MNTTQPHLESMPITTINWNDTFSKTPDDWFFGTEPSEMARLSLSYWKLLRGGERGSLLDHGCGEGRDSVFMTLNGFDVTAVDGAESAIVKTERLAKARSVEIANIHLIDVTKFVIDREYSVVFSHNCLQFLAGGCLAELARLQNACAPGGLISVSSFTNESDALANRTDVYRFDRYELKFQFSNWRILYYGEYMLWREPTQNYLSFAHVIAERPSL